MTQAKRSSRRDYADRLWRRFINLRDGFCQMADGACAGRLEAAHIIRRGIFPTRWDPDNGVLLCQAHHRIFDGVFDKHAFARQHLGDKRWDALKAKATSRWDRDYAAVIADLRARLEEVA